MRIQDVFEEITRYDDEGVVVADNPTYEVVAAVPDTAETESEQLKVSITGIRWDHQEGMIILQLAE